MPSLREQLRSLGAVELENTGSVARDHLANERTFLAWLRTSLSMASLGIAITQLFKIAAVSSADTGPRERMTLAEAKGVGGAFIGSGMLIMLVGSFRYFSVQTHLMRGVFPPSRLAVAVSGFFVGAVIIAGFAVVMARRLRVG